MVSNKAQKMQAYSRLAVEDKDEMIKKYLPLVKRVVYRLLGRVPRDVNPNEMLNSGIIGLVDALEKYDPKHKVNFESYAQIRIKGAILDSFRRQDLLPRTLRFRTHKIEKAYRKAEQKLGRAASEEEVAEMLEMTLDDFREMLNEVSNVVMFSFEELGFGKGEEKFQADENLPSHALDPLHKLIGAEKVNLVARALDRLPSKERLVVSLYFYEELNLREIADIMGVTESRASQIRAKALIRLKRYLQSSYTNNDQ